MILKREEPWGKLLYDTSKHRFWIDRSIDSRIQTNGKDLTPYVLDPVVLNAYLTMKCNLNCRHCVTKDFDKKDDLVISEELINWINESKFMVVVITGGEPLLPEYENQLVRLLREIHGKGLVVDTNGTIFPSRSVIETILDTNALVRISWDTTYPKGELYFRHAITKSPLKRNYRENYKWHEKKLYEIIPRFRSAGVNLAIQSVVHRHNLDSIFSIAEVLRYKYSINQWYIQRFIPAHRATQESLVVSTDTYERVVQKLIETCRSMKIECITKKDRRHNCVVMLIGDGFLYTQGEEPGLKIPLGRIGSNIRYFDYMSFADHAERYYGSY